MSIGTSLFSGGLLYTMLSSCLHCMAGCLLARSPARLRG